MKTITLNNSNKVQISYEIYRIDGSVNLYRKISGLDSNPKLGYHRVHGYSCFIPIELCYDGVDSHAAYKGFKTSYASEYHTHPLNHIGPGRLA